MLAQRHNIGFKSKVGENGDMFPMERIAATARFFRY